MLVCVGGTAKMSSSLFTPHTIVCERTPYYENTSVRCRRLMGVTRRRGAARFIRFSSLPGGGGVLRRLCIRFLPAAVALHFAAFLTFLPSTTSPAFCASVVSARFPKATAPRLIRGAADRMRPLNKLPNPCPLCTGKTGQCPTHLPCIAVVVIHVNSPELHRRTRSVTVNLPCSNVTGRPVSSLIYVSMLPNSPISTVMYWTWSIRAVTISPCLPVIGTIRSSGAILSPTMRCSSMLE